MRMHTDTNEWLIGRVAEPKDRNKKSSMMAQNLHEDDRLEKMYKGKIREQGKLISWRRMDPTWLDDYEVASEPGPQIVPKAIEVQVLPDN